MSVFGEGFCKNCKKENEGSNLLFDKQRVKQKTQAARRGPQKLGSSGNNCLI